LRRSGDTTRVAGGGSERRERWRRSFPCWA
jgi:hypothetical protein